VSSYTINQEMIKICTKLGGDILDNEVQQENLINLLGRTKSGFSARKIQKRTDKFIDSNILDH